LLKCQSLFLIREFKVSPLRPAYKNHKTQKDIPARWVAQVWIASGFSSEMVIPKKLAKKYDMDEPCTVVLEEKENGILIRRLDL
jgi:hypothetical protein